MRRRRTLILAIIALRVSARNPGELSALDRGILRAGVAGAGGDVVRRARHHRRRRPLRRADRTCAPRTTTLRRENRQLRAELIEMRRLAEESRPLPAPARACATRRRPRRSRRASIAVDASPYFRVARVEHRPRRRDGPARDAGADARGRGRAASTASRARARTCCCWSIRARRIDVIVPRTGGRGILRGKSGENGYRCSIEYLARGEPAQGRRRGRHQRRGRRVPAQPRGRPRHPHHPGRGRASTRTSRSRPTSTSRA